MRQGLWRSRWAAVGAAVAVSLGGGGLFVANAAAPGPATAYRAVAPTRAIDTRDGTGVRAGMVGPGETLTFSFVGVAGVPAAADSVAINLTVVGGTQASFLTVYPPESTRNVCILGMQRGDRAGTIVSLIRTSGRTAAAGRQPIRTDRRAPGCRPASRSRPADVATSAGR